MLLVCPLSIKPRPQASQAHNLNRLATTMPIHRTLDLIRKLTQGRVKHNKWKVLSQDLHFTT
ncbi:hypothetical protein Taro_040835 [Colocasia esculenta]|uniref:Uncharacterized protein n=1 Tax=Colocasia esculenta TaxID=4460 RepID=A0A843WJV3_COLES|nr:hypothetical protein [Colocasia esculenta]